MFNHFFASVIFILMTGPSVGKISQNCKQCHLPKNHHEKFYMADLATFDRHNHRETSCVSCHINLHILAKNKTYPNWVVFSKNNIDFFMNNLLYISAPPLENTFQDARGLTKNRYVKDGLKQFLLSPVPRYAGATSSMFPLAAHDVDELLSIWRNNLDKAPESIGDKKSFKRGKNLFAACARCHTQSPTQSSHSYNIPLLRIGYPLLSYDYFYHKIKNGSRKQEIAHYGKINKFDIPMPMLRIPFLSHLYCNKNIVFLDEYSGLNHINSWQLKSGDNILRSLREKEVMSAFSHLSDKDIKDLYVYTAYSDEDLIRSYEIQPNKDFLIGIDLYYAVEKNLFKTSCVHCHSDAVLSNKAIKNTFFLKDDSKIMPFPPHENANYYKSYWQDIFQPTKNCGPAKLVQRLLRRHDEWQGKTINGDGIRGMPLTLPPVAKEIIDQARFWTDLGCPSPYGPLCSGCEQ